MGAIADLIHRYADAVCRFDPDQWAATWAPDGIWDMGQTKVEGREAIGETWKSIMGGIPAVFHVYYNGTTDLDDATGTGTGRWYIGEFLRLPDDSTIAMYGYYDDEYVKVDGEWLFRTRTLTPLYRGPADMSGEFMRASAAD